MIGHCHLANRATDRRRSGQSDCRARYAVGAGIRRRSRMSYPHRGSVRGECRPRGGHQAKVGPTGTL